MTKLHVYNLQFKYGCKEMDIAGYKFERVPDYEDSQSKLQHTVNMTSEFSNQIQDGQHSHTANVSIPETEEKQIIPRTTVQATALDDVITLLCLFTCRDVFCIDPSLDTSIQWISRRDHRAFGWGGILCCSIKPSKVTEPRSYVDKSIETSLNQIYALMKSKEWQDQFKQGYYLILLLDAIKQTSLESSFTQCWTIWEHLFACVNDSWMSGKVMRGIASREKINFLLIHFKVLESLGEEDKRRTDDLVNIRNRLIHYGIFPVGTNVHADAVLFIRLTEYITAKSLGLVPSEIHSTFSKLKDFLNNEENRKIR